MVYCIGWHEHKKWYEIEISSDFKVYPCCTLHAEHQLEKTFFDDKLDAMDDDWNDLKNPLKNIMKIWREYISLISGKMKKIFLNVVSKLC